MDNKKSMKSWQLVVGDILFIIICFGILLLTNAFYVKTASLFLIDSSLIKVTVIIFEFYLVLCFVALFIPKIKPGKYDLGSLEVTLWFLSFNFARIWNYDLIKHPLFCLNTFRWFFLKCLGAKINFGTAISSNVKLLDVHLITVGSGCTLGFDSVIVPHYIIDNKLVLDPISIGNNSLLGAETKIAPGVTIGDNVTIHAATHFLPNSTIPSGVIVGHHSIIAKYMKFEPGSKIPPFTK